MDNLIDNYHWDECRKILTNEEIKINNLESIGHWRNNKATTPLPPHIHRDCMEFVVMIKGSQKYYINDKTYNITGGDVFISFENQLHGTKESPQDVSEIIWFKINMNFQAGFLGLADEFGMVLYRKLELIKEHTIRTDEENIKLIKQCFELFSSSNRVDIAMGQSLFVTFLNRLIRYNSNENTLSNGIEEAINYINENIYENLEIRELSEISGLSESRFKHKFKQEVGITPRDYINKQKIREAKILLKGHDNITNLAVKLGFDTSNYFSVVFKRYTSYTPSEYRNKFLKKL